MASKDRGPKIKDHHSSPSTSRGKTWFLGIGINAYQNWPPLQNAVRDVTAIRDLLVKQYGLEQEKSKLLLNKKATRSSIINQLDRWADTIQSPDSLIIYYAGHGHLKRRSGFWVPFEATLGETIDDYLPNSRIKELIGEIPSLHTLLISDSCFSGSLLLRGQRGGTMAAEKLAALPSRYAICSGRHGETVSDGPAGGHSPFAQSILRELQNNNHPYLTAESLKERVFERTATRADQTPLGAPLRVEGHELGQYVFWRVNDEKSAWQQAQAENTIEGYLHYRGQFPRGQFRKAVITAIEHLEQEEENWKQAHEKDRVSAYLAYLDDYPHGQFAEEARDWIRKRQEAKVGGSVKKTKPNKVVNTQDDGLIHIESGSFMMGSEEYNSEQPIHTVQVPSFYLGQYPVTFAEYDAYCAAMGKQKPKDKGWGRDRRPVIYVSWEDAVDYCNWLSSQRGLAIAYDKKRNLIVGTNGYRLPSEAEWEYAAQGGQKSQGFRFAGSDTLGEVGWYSGNLDGKTQPVGLKKANELGLYDMSGNVWEWCHDWYGKYPAEKQTNPTGQAEGSNRVLRGGSWHNNPQHCRAANRNYWVPPLRGHYVGFRLARSF